MAEIAVSFAIEQLLPLLTNEIKLLKGVHKEFADIKDELESIQAFLKDADRRAAIEGDNTGDGVKVWVKQVREVAFRIEDVIDDYMIRVGQKPRDPGCVPLLNKISSMLKHMTPRHQIASEIQEIKSSVRDIKERSKRYDFRNQPVIGQGSSGLRENQNAKWHNLRMAALYIDEADVVGFQAPKSRLIDWLVEGRAERTVISVVGMGGQGKTTLAKKVFDSKEVVGHFDCRVWITVSQSYNIEGLLRGMLKELYKQKGDRPPQDISEMDRGSLISELRNYLQQKRYIFLFDDVWNISFWDDIEHAVIDNKNGSKILITTRNRDVAIHCKTSSFNEVHEMLPLTKEQSFELFSKKAFRFDFGGCCPKELMDVSSEIVRKCKGLPLAIVTTGGLLSTKQKDAFKLQKFNENMTSELQNDSHLSGISKILGFSYDDLPFYLKPCFLYFGIYPEDYEVGSKRLIRQWVAEGFVKQERGYTLEEVAEGYLTELIHRSLVQVSSVRLDGKTKSCCVHDLIRMMILEKSEEISFCKHISEDDHSSLFGIIRRHSLTTCSKNFPASTENLHVRSLFLFKDGSQQMNEDNFMRRILTECRRLKVLDIEGAFFFQLNGNMGSLIHLKYLSFCGSIIEIAYPEILQSICMLLNLETLDLRASFAFNKLPKEISNLRKLRHLLGYNMSLLQLKHRIGCMESLETLSEVWIDEDGIELITELKNLKKLRKLGLANIQREHGSALSSLLKESRHLEKLHIKAKTSRHGISDGVIDIHLESPPPMLRNLKLNGELNKFPRWILQLQNLLKLKLVRSKLTDYPIEHLENMSNLLSLSITDEAYFGTSLHFHNGGFQNLKELYIKNLPYLKSIVIDNGALPSLKKFQLSRIRNLKTVPAGIQYLKKLEVLDVFEVPHVEMYPKL